MKGVILAAGKGTRLYPVTQHIPKPLLPLANRPTLHYALDRLKEIDVKDICLVVGENESEMRFALGDGSSLGVRLRYARQSEPLGLAHAMSFAQDFVGEDDFIMYLGDAIYTHGLAELRQKFESSGCANLNLVMPVDDPTRFGVANVNGDRIVRLVEKPKQPESNLAMAGVYFFKKRIWDTLPVLQPSGRGEYEITDAIQILVDWGEVVLAGVHKGKWFDTGTLDSFLACSDELLGGGALVGRGAVVDAELGRNVCIGDGAALSCSFIEDATILPQSRVTIRGCISHSLIGGRLACDHDLQNEIVFGVD